MEDLSPGQGRKLSGVVVREVEEGSAADRAGLRPGDIIREINRKPIRSVDDFERTTGQLAPKRSVLVLLSRDNATIFMSISPYSPQPA